MSGAALRAATDGASARAQSDAAGPPAREDRAADRPPFEHISSRHATFDGDASAPQAAGGGGGDAMHESPAGRKSAERAAHETAAPPDGDPMPRCLLDAMRQARPGALIGGGHGTAHLMADPAAMQPRHEPVPEADPFQPLAAAGPPAPHHRHFNSASTSGRAESSMGRSISSGYSLGSNRYSMALQAPGTDLTDAPPGGLDLSRRSGSVRVPLRNSIELAPVHEAGDPDDPSSSAGSGLRMAMSHSGNGRGGAEGERAGRPAD